MDLNETLHAAVASPPPTGIDLDTLIGRELRRGRRHRVLGAAGGAMALTAAVGAIGFALPGGPGGNGTAGGPGNRLGPDFCAAPSWYRHSPTPSTSPRNTGLPPTAPPEPTVSPPTPTESCEHAARRLGAALADALPRIVPDLHFEPVEFYGRPNGEYFYGTPVADGAGRLKVELEPYGGDPPSCRNECMSRNTRQDGSVVTTNIMMTDYANLTDVAVWKPDHTLVRVYVLPTSRAWPTGDLAPAKPVSEAQRLAIADLPEMTLFP